MKNCRKHRRESCQTWTGPGDPCISYGSNWGPMQSFKKNTVEGGLYSTSTRIPSSRRPVRVTFACPGISMTSMDSPAEMFAFGDSEDTPWYTVCMGSILSRTWLAGELTSAGNGANLSSLASVRHGGKFNFGFADGHSKMVQMAGGIWTGGSQWPAYGTQGNQATLFPANGANYKYYCANPTSTITTDIGPIVCQDIPALIASQTVRWSN